MNGRPRVLVCCNSTVRREYVAGEGLQRLERLAEWEWLPAEGMSSREGVWGGPSDDPADATRLRAKLAEGFDALIVCHGASYVDAPIFDAAPRVRLVGELEGDRFANRVDVEAAIEHGVRVVDTTHGSSLPVAEWALGLMLIGLRNAGEQFRRLVDGEEFHRSTEDPGYRLGELTGRSVGLIGLGHIGRRLIELLAPFRCPVLAYDPYVSKEVALALHVELAPLERVMAESDVVVCTAPLTPRTRRMLGAAELDLLKTDAVFVNVSRGAIVDPDALIARARRGDIRVGIDVFDPEPIPAASPIRELPNVFMSPHIAGVTAACRPRFFSFMVDELERFFGGHDTLFDITPSTLANRRGLVPGGRPMTEPFKIGKIAQVAFVVRNLEARMQVFWEDFGIGPWSIYAFEPPRVKDMTYRGQRQDFRMRVAFAMCGETQIELVQSVAGPNLYEEFLAQCGEGVQHLGIHVSDMDSATGQMRALGYELIQSGRGYGVRGDGAFAYFATADRLSTLIELIQLPQERYPPDATYPRPSD